MITSLPTSQLSFAQNYNLRVPAQRSLSSTVSVNQTDTKFVPLETHKAYALVSFEGKNKQSFPEQLAETAKNVAESMNTEGSCKKGVRIALERHGITLKGLSAYMASSQLAKNSMFTEIKVKRSELQNLNPGTIVVWDKCPGHPDGHISIALGDGQEASDCIRNQFVDYGPRYRAFEPKESNSIKNKLFSRPTIVLLHGASKAKHACVDLVKGKSNQKTLDLTDN